MIILHQAREKILGGGGTFSALVGYRGAPAATADQDENKTEKDEGLMGGTRLQKPTCTG